MRIAVAGMGYVGLSNAVLLARQHVVSVFDIVPEKVAMLNGKRSPIHDRALEEALGNSTLHLHATLDVAEAFGDADYIIIATSTNFDVGSNRLDTSTVEEVIAQALALAPMATIVIRSTVPVGFTRRMREIHGSDAIVFMPEFLREGSALNDNLYPSRIVVGDTSAQARILGDLFVQASLTPDVPVLLTGPSEAEAIKLFANSYLAMRVAFFNELDNYAVVHALNSAQIIEGVGYDGRIGTHYNNPSFGYGGYCLPKDTKQLLGHFDGVPQQLIGAIVESNRVRMDFVAQHILARHASCVGIYRLIMKAGSDNFREASIVGVIERLQQAGAALLIYEPLLPEGASDYGEVTHDLARFKQQAGVIVANRVTADIADVESKVYTRDIYGRD